MLFNKLENITKYKKYLIKAKLKITEGSVPRDINTFMFISKSEIFGTVGGGQLEYLIINKAKEILKDKKSKYSSIINIPLGPSIGQCCGGYVQVELNLFNNGSEAYNSEKLFFSKIYQNLYIFGAGHIGQELAKRSLGLDFDINLIDSRKEYLMTPKEKKINKIYARFPWMIVKNLPKNSYYIILTHSHDFDFKIINEIFNLNSFNFIGLIGSKTKSKKFNNRLTKLGYNKLLIDRIECPIGLINITSKIPSEIAVSIIGRLLEFRSNQSSITIKNNELVNLNA